MKWPPLLRPVLKYVLLGLGGLLLAIQLVPYGRKHENSAVRREPTWDSARTRELAKRACFDCHSHESVWPWYSHVAPASWLVQNHIDEGREHLNFSDWRSPKDAEEAAEELAEGEMPPSSYLWLHPEARLSRQEKDELIRGLRKLR